MVKTLALLFFISSKLSLYKALIQPHYGLSSQVLTIPLLSREVQITDILLSNTTATIQVLDKKWFQMLFSVCDWCQPNSEIMGLLCVGISLCGRCFSVSLCLSQGPDGLPGLPGADGLPGKAGTVLMMPVRKYAPLLTVCVCVCVCVYPRLCLNPSLCSVPVQCRVWFKSEGPSCVSPGVPDAVYDAAGPGEYTSAICWRSCL